MSKNKKSITIVFLIVNILILVIFGVVAFFGANQFEDICINGVNDKKNWADIIKIKWFSDEDDYKRSSDMTIDMMKSEMVNDAVNCMVETGFTFNAVSEYGIKISAEVDGDYIYGNLNILKDDEHFQGNEFYMLKENNNTMKLYIQHENQWYVYDGDIQVNWLNFQTIFDKFKNLEYRKYPTRTSGNARQTLYAASDIVDTIQVCNCGKLGGVTFKELSIDTMEEMFSIGGADVLLESMRDNNIQCTPYFKVHSIGHMFVELPKDVIDNAVSIEDLSTIFENLNNDLYGEVDGNE